jgi:hypothetical protein
MRIASWSSVVFCLSAACSRPAQPPPPTTAVATTVASATAEQGRTRLVLQRSSAQQTVMLERDDTVAAETAPSRVALLASVQPSAIVVVDTYPSVAGGLSYCQAGEEIFLRVISVAGDAPRVTYGTKAGSCRGNLELADPGIAWDAATSTVRVHWLTGPSGKEEVLRIIIHPDGRADAAFEK